MLYIKIKKHIFGIRTPKLITKNVVNMRIRNTLKKFFTLTAIVLAFSSCTDKEVRLALKSLDKTLENRQIWRNEFRNRAEILSSRCNDSNLDLHSRWNAADSLNFEYRHYQTDSSYKYLRKMDELASSDRERFLTRLSEIRMHLTMCDVWEAYEKFSETDTTMMMDTVMLKEYLSTGIAVCHNLSRESDNSSQKMFLMDRMTRMRSRFISISPKSFEGLRYKAQSLSEIGEYDKAVEIFEELYENETEKHILASLSYNLARIYKLKGDINKAMIWFARTADYDFKTPVRDYLSLYDLANLCYEEGMVSRADKYIRLNMNDIVSGNIRSRIFSSSHAQMLLSDAERRSSRIVIIIISIGLVIIGALSAILLVLLRKSHKINVKLKESYDKLNDSNAIKDNYMFRYMSLSIEYLERMVEIRKKLKQTAQKEGVEAMMNQLKSPDEMYGEYDRFYSIFDETFLGLYPDFVDKVNALLKEECRFKDLPQDSLNTELRILAAIRIGITQSGRIATFLKCSPATVYTYRTKLRNSAICDKNEFESRIAKL